MPIKLTASQQETVNKIKTAFTYRSGLVNSNITDHKDFISFTGEGTFFMNTFQALIGKHGGIHVYREGNIEWKGKTAESHIYYILKEMEAKGLYKFPVYKPKQDPVVYGIKFYTTGERKANQGFYSIGINRNALTEKYFKWAFPNDDMYGVIFEYSYMSNGGDGLMLIDLPSGERERVSFAYEPRQFLVVRGVNYEEQIEGRLNNRQIIAKVFKAWLRSRNLL